MITTHHDLAAPSAGPAAASGLPPDADIERITLACGGTFQLASVARSAVDADDVVAHDAKIADVVARAAAWAAANETTAAASLTAAAGLTAAAAVTVVPLYGTHMVWSPRRAAIIGPPERLPQMRAAVVEFAGHDAELRDVESRITEALAHVDADAPLAFHFDERALPRRGDLAARFSQAVSLRRRLAMLAPAVQQPAPQPPTLAGQLGERLRDRTRIVERLESAVDQAELLERVYFACADRVGDYAVSRRHAILEWVIILLLAAELMLLVVGLLAVRTT